MILNNGDTGLVHSTKCTDGDIFRKFTWLDLLYSCLNAGVSDQFRRIQEFYKAEVEAFKSWNSYKTWHEITRLSAPAQISHILLKVWLCWSLLRAVRWTLGTCSVDSRRPYPGVVHCRAHHAVQDLFLLGPATKLLFSRGRDAWHVTADTWHSVTSRLFAASPKVSRGQNDSSRQRCDKQLVVVRERGDITITFGAVVKVWSISNRMSKYFINKNNFSDMVLSSKTRTQNIN